MNWIETWRGAVRLFAAGLACFLGVSYSLAEAPFSLPQNLSVSLLDSVSPQVASSGANVYLVWQETIVTDGVSNREVFFARSLDGGKTFQTAQNLSNMPGFSFGPQVAASGEDVYVLWSEATADYLVHSSDSGETFGPALNLTSSFGFFANFEAALSASGSSVFVVGRQSVAGYGDIFVAKSTNKGATFDAPINVSNTNGVNSVKPRIAASGSSIYVVWQETPVGGMDVYYARSLDGGATFEAPANVTPLAGTATTPDVWTHGASVWVVWSERVGTEKDEVMMTRSLDGGNSFSIPTNLSNNTSGSTAPSVKGSGTKVCVSWADAETPGGTGPTQDIFLICSEDSGATFNSPNNISTSPSVGSGMAKVSLTSSVVAVSWAESQAGGLRDIFMSYLETAVPDPSPSLTDVSPASARQGTAVTLQLTGDHFANGIQVLISGSGVDVNSVQFESVSQIAVQVTVQMSAPVGSRDVTVMNPGGLSAVLPGGFMVTSATTASLLEIARNDVMAIAGAGGFNGNSSFKSLLAHLDNAQDALDQEPTNLSAALSQLDAFCIKIGNMSKGKKPEISASQYATLYGDYVAIMNSLGATPKPPL
ncbi:MAG: sialidase family protein [Acidobacteriota bacterium]